MIKKLFSINAVVLSIPDIDNIKLASEILAFPRRKTTDAVSTMFEDTILNVYDGSEAKRVIDYITKYGDEHEMTLNGYWSQIHNYLESTDIHHHGFVNFSWVYYVKVPKDSGKLVFILDTKDDRAPKAVFEPKEGDLIIFPSYIQHKVTKNMNKEPRISISGDFIQR